MLFSIDLGIGEQLKNLINETKIEYKTRKLFDWAKK
jgi:hypothetical protein